MQEAFFKNQRSMGAPIILNLWKFFTDWLQNLAERFIGIQEYFNDIVSKQEWPSGPQSFKNPKALYWLLLNFETNLHTNKEVFNIKNIYRDEECLLGSLAALKILNLWKFFANCLKFDTTLHSSKWVFFKYIF